MLKHAKWIARNDSMEMRPAPLFRKDFTIQNEVASAKLYACGLGHGLYFLNGEKVTENVLLTPISKYDSRVYYDVFDVTGLLRQGKNVIGAVLGNGWYFVTYHRWDYYKPDWMHRPKLLLKLVLKYTDNTIEEVVSDHSWKTQDSAILYNENKRGEIYDAREEIEGWKNPDFDDALCRNTIPTIRVTQKIGAKKLKNNIYELCREVEDKYWDQLADVDRQNLKVLQRYWKK